jgi:hypothetical protein
MHACNSDRVIKFACTVRKVTYICKDREEKTYLLLAMEMLVEED